MAQSSSVLANLNSPGQRFARHDNPFGLRRMDHFALETNDIDLMDRFMREVLGGEAFYYAGFDQTDRDLGRVKHIFIRVGSVLMQCAESKDGKTNLDKLNQNVSPHWAFEVSAEDLDSNIARLRGLGIPVSGPIEHRDLDCTCAYFQSPEGHKFELCTWDAYPGKRIMGRIDWPSLAHDWPNTKAAAK